MAGGRPTKYKSEYVDQVYRLCLIGLTDKQLAKYFECSEATLNTWKKRYPKFLESLKKGKEIADGEVALSLFKRACGYSHPEEKVFCNEGHITTHETIKHYPPDTAACFIWLKNRAGWRDRHEHAVSGEVALPRPTYNTQQLNGEATAPPFFTELEEKVNVKH